MKVIQNGRSRYLSAIKGVPDSYKECEEGFGE